MSVVGRIRSFTVPRGSKFVVVPLDGGGPLVVEAGCQVTIAVTESWERAIEGMRELLEREEPRK